LKRLAFALVLLAAPAWRVCAQLTFYVDERGRRVFINADPKPAAPTADQESSAKKAKVTPRIDTSAWRREPPAAAESKPAEPERAEPLTATAVPESLTLTEVATPVEIDALVREAAARHDVDANLLRAMIRAESNYNPKAVSRKGALGLMQLMPFTARDLGVRNVFDPRQNVDGGTRYLKSLLGRFGGDLNRSLAAYNAGPGAVERYGGVPPYRETVNYLKKINGLYGSLTLFPSRNEGYRGIVKYVDESGKVYYTNLQ
jgi:soluble lytic murein transglycosylase-like protein